MKEIYSLIKALGEILGKTYNTECYTFIDFSFEIREHLYLLTTQIDTDRINLSELDYDNYKKIVGIKLNELVWGRENVSLEKINGWLKTYKYNCKATDLILNSILNLDDECKLQSDLSIPYNSVENYNNANHIVNLQNDFFTFTKASVKNYLLDFLERRTLATEKNKQNYKTFTWFKIGIEFAKGRPQELFKRYKNENGVFTKICQELGYKKSDKNYFSETLNNTTTSNKNIYSNLEKLLKIQVHCLENGIVVTNDFKDQITLLQSK